MSTMMLNAAQASMVEYVQNALAFRRDMMNKLVDPKRDIDKECGYPVTIEATHYQQFWERHGVARRVVKLEPKESWKKPPYVFETEEEDETEFEAAWESLVKRLNIWEMLERADVVSGILTYGVLLIGVNDGQTLDKPLQMIEVDWTGENREGKPGDTNETGSKERPVPTKGGKKVGKQPPKPLVKNAKEVKNREVTFLRVFDESTASIIKYDADETSPRFGQPEEYQIRFTAPRPMYGLAQGAVEQVTKTVHWSRIVHLADNRTTSELIGTPRMQEVFNDLYDWKKIRGGSAEMFWKGGFPGYSFEMMPEVLSAMNAGQDVSVNKEAMAKEMEDFSNSLSRYMSLVGVSAKSLAPQVADPSKHIESILTSIAIAKEIPLRILMGSEQAQLASGQDKGTWKERVQHRQEFYVSPCIIRAFVDRLIALGCLPMPVEYIVKWPDLFAPSGEEIAKIAQLLTAALAQYVGGNVEAIYPFKLFLQNILKMTPEEADAILEGALEAERLTEDPNDVMREQMDHQAGQSEEDRKLAKDTQAKDLQHATKTQSKALQTQEKLAKDKNKAEAKKPKPAAAK